ncbi:MAG: hypothetical protein KDA91_00510 [Planctomycetaceae bacterium]|nr:hypothetical protein [Planctomycetaceae bacterium]
MVRRHTTWIVFAVVVLAGLYWTFRDRGPAPPYIFYTKPLTGHLSPPDVDVPVEPLAGKVVIKLGDQECGPQPIHLKSNTKVDVSGFLVPAEELNNGRCIESVQLGIAYKDRNRLGWSVGQEVGLGGPGTCEYPGGPLTRHIEGAWQIPEVTGEAWIIVLISVTESGKIRPWHTAATFPVVFD